MPVDRAIFSNEVVDRKDLALARQLFPRTRFADIFRDLLARWQAPQLLTTDRDGNCVNPRAHEHLEKCPLAAFPVADLQRLPLTLATPPQEAQP